MQKTLIIDFATKQGLGNQLWLYASVRAIAKRNGFSFVVLNYSNFVGNGIFDLNQGEPIRTKSNLITTLHEIMYWDEKYGTLSCNYDKTLEERIITSNSSHIKVEGLLQSERYIGMASALSELLTVIPYRRSDYSLGENACVIYIRGGEYKRHKNIILPRSYWLGAMNCMRSKYGAKKFYAVSDDDAYVKNILPEVDLLPGDMTSDYRYLAEAKLVILANSSWGYFPAKAYNFEKTVIAPKYWVGFNNGDRWVSPANAYADWLWMDRHGNVSSAMQPVSLSHLNDHHVLVPYSHVRKKRYREIVPHKWRNILKKILGKIFPNRIG